MKNFNCNSYQAYHQPSTSSQQQQQQQQQRQQSRQQQQQQHNQRHHPYSNQLQQQQQQQLPPLYSLQPPSGHPPNYPHQQLRATISRNASVSSSVASHMAALGSASYLPNNSYNNNNNNNHNLNYHANPANLTYAANNLQQQQYNNNNNQNMQIQLQQQQQQQQQYQQQQRPQQLSLPLQQRAPQQQQQHVESSPHACDKLAMDACEIANFLANELFMQQLVSLDGIQSGVPTQTTSTLTPTTLRSIEETFMHLTSEPPINMPYQAGFIPPPLAPLPTTTAFNNSFTDYTDANATESEEDDSQASWNGAQFNEDNSMATTDTSSAATDSTSYQNGLSGLGNNSLATSNASSTNDFSGVNIAIATAAAATKGGSNTSNSATPATGRRNQGGRRPTKTANISPEEEEKRRIRRERNKLAAARCRKRRVDQTNELQDEVAQLEKKRGGLEKDIAMLNTTKKELEYILELHRTKCQKLRQDIHPVDAYGGLIVPTTIAAVSAHSPNRNNNHNKNHNNNNNNGEVSSNITGLDASLVAAPPLCVSPIDLKPEVLNDSMLVPHIKDEPLDAIHDSNSSSLEHDGPPSPKRLLLSSNNPMVPPPLPNVATLSAQLAAAAAASASASLNTPIVTTAPMSFGGFASHAPHMHATLNALNKPPNKQRPNTLPTMPRHLAQNLALSVDGKPPTDINGVAIQTPSTGMFNFDSLMDGGTGLTPVSGPLVPTCSSQNKHPLELATPTSDPSKLVSL